MKFKLFIFCFIYYNFCLSQTATLPSGSGTIANPYQIATLNNLYWVTQNTSSWNSYFVQTADINAASSSTWASGQGYTPIGNSSTKFTGNFDGAGYKISNIIIYRTTTFSNTGLFGNINTNAFIKNVNVENISITIGSGSIFIGGFVGKMDGGTIQNCTVSGTINVSTNNGSSFAGFVGIMAISGSISKCYADVSVNVAHNGGVRNANCGGFVGWMNNNTCIIDQCFAKGNVYGDSNVGGFVGSLNTGIISNSYSTGSVYRNTGATATTLGGFVGGNGTNSSTTNCYSSGGVFYTGVANPTNKGFSGGSTNFIVSNCYFNKTISNQLTSSSTIDPGVQGKTSTEMRLQSTFIGWDFGSANPVWFLNSSVNNGFPYLSIGIKKWSGATNTSWSTNTNWENSILPSTTDNIFIPQSANNPSINTGSSVSVNSITIASGARLTMNGGTLTANNITVQPDAALIGTSEQITSTVTLQQNIIRQRGWRIFSNPFSTSQTIATVAGNNGITIGTSVPVSGITDSRIWDNSNNLWNNVTSSSWSANIPYALFIRGLSSEVTGSNYSGGPSPFVYQVNGTLNSNSVSFSATNSSNFMLVGNPYAAPINSQALTGGNSNVPYYVYSISQGANASAQRTKAGSWVAASSNSNTTNTIPVLGVLAFMPSNISSFNVTNNDINTIGTLQNGLFRTEYTLQQLELILNKDSVFADKLFVRYDQNSTKQGNEKLDLKKFDNDLINFYTISSDKIHLAVDSRNTICDTISLGIQAAIGNYAINVGINTLPQGTIIYLKDKLFNIQTELKDGVSYSFDITNDSLTQGVNRFELYRIKNFKARSTQNIKLKILDNLISNNRLSIEVEGLKDKEGASIIIVDINGRIILNKNVINGISEINLANWANGIYFIKLSNGKENITKKIVKQ
jgi:hypothetical protein